MEFFEKEKPNAIVLVKENDSYLKHFDRAPKKLLARIVATAFWIFLDVLQQISMFHWKRELVLV